MVHRVPCLRVLVFALTVLIVSPCAGQQRNKNYPPKFEGARAETYKSVRDVELKVWIFNPADLRQGDRRAAVVFFFGGGWRAGSPGQFEQHCRHLARRGMVAMTADYRVSSRHGTKARECVEDGKSAVRWIRQNADRLGIDPKRIVAAGGSAGGHVAACTGIVKGFEVGDESISSRPNAMALFNPATVLAPAPGLEAAADRLKNLESRMGVAAEKLSPWHQIQQGAPPTIVFHGKADTTVAYQTAEMFAEKMREHKARCELKGYAGQGHGFFNYGRSKNVMYKRTIADLDQFLESLGYLREPRNDRGTTGG